jgi:D-arginine dehydrogenase
MSSNSDVIIIGAGIAGTSLAAQLAVHCRVILLEMESQPGYHATGRSAAVFAPAYGNQIVRDITGFSESFYRSPPTGFSNVPLLRQRDTVFIARHHQSDSLRSLLADHRHLSHLSTSKLAKRIPIFDANQTCTGALDSTGGDLDVDAIMQGFLKLIRSNKGQVITGARVTALTRDSSIWKVTTNNGEFEADVVVNAAGAWADVIAKTAGLTGLGISPLRRTALLVDPPADHDISGWPVVVDVDEQFYFKPEAGQILISPADETPSNPCDAQPEELDLALAVDRVQQVIQLDVRKINHRWAGLRSFAPDKTFVTGFDPRIKGFFWLAGQGGYGVQTAPGLSDIACYLITGQQNLITDAEASLHIEDIAPDRFL